MGSFKEIVKKKILSEGSVHYFLVNIDYLKVLDILFTYGTLQTLKTLLVVLLLFL